MVEDGGWWVFDGVGTAGEWVAGLGAFAAVALALGIEARGNSRRRAEDLRRAKDIASLFVIVEQGGRTSASSTGWLWTYYVENRGSLNVYDVQVFAHLDGASEPAERLPLVRPIDRQMLGGVAGHENRPVAWSVEFSDPEGRRWRQDTDGRAVLLRATPERRWWQFWRK